MTETVDFSRLGFHGPVHAHDVWQAKDLTISAPYSFAIPGHGVILLRVH